MTELPSEHAFYVPSMQIKQPHVALTFIVWPGGLTERLLLSVMQPQTTIMCVIAVSSVCGCVCVLCVHLCVHLHAYLVAYLCRGKEEEGSSPYPPSSDAELVD